MSFAGTGAGAGLPRPLACGRMVEMSAESVPSIPTFWESRACGARCPQACYSFKLNPSEHDSFYRCTREKSVKDIVIPFRNHNHNANLHVRAFFLSPVISLDKTSTLCGTNDHRRSRSATLHAWCSRVSWTVIPYGLRRHPIYLQAG